VRRIVEPIQVAEAIAEYVHNVSYSDFKAIFPKYNDYYLGQKYSAMQYSCFGEFWKNLDAINQRLFIEAAIDRHLRQRS